MEAWKHIAISFISGALWGGFAYAVCAIRYNRQIKALVDMIHHLEQKKEKAPKFRQMTAQSDPNRQAQVRSARMRAIKYPRPPGQR